MSPGCAWAYLAQRDETPDWIGEGRAKALLAIVEMVGETVVREAVEETVAMTVDITVETAVVTMMGLVVIVGLKSLVDMVVVLEVELELPSVGESLEATQ